MESSRPVSVLKVQIFLLRRSLTLLLRSVFLSEDGRKMGRWRCPARVTALLLCKGWQEGDAEKEEEQLLLAGDVQVTFVAVNDLSLLLVQGRVWQYGRDGASPLPSSLSCPVTSLRLHSGSLMFIHPIPLSPLQSSLSPSCFLMSSCSSCSSMSFLSLSSLR